MAKTPTHVDTDALTRQITRTPFPGSRKIYLDGTRAEAGSTASRRPSSTAT